MISIESFVNISRLKLSNPSIPQKFNFHARKSKEMVHFPVWNVKFRKNPLILHATLLSIYNQKLELETTNKLIKNLICKCRFFTNMFHEEK